MPSKLCYGTNGAGYQIIESLAYCEGRTAAAAGELIGVNPHEANSSASAAWVNGFNSWAADPAAGPGVDCCDIPYGGGYTP